MSACAPVRGPVDAWGRMRLWEKFSPTMQTLQRRSCQTRARSRKKACVYGVRVSRATIFGYVGGNPLSYFDPLGLAPDDPYPSQHAAAKAAVNDRMPASLQRNKEYAGMIYKNPNGSYSYTKPNEGTVDSSNPGGPAACPARTTPTGYYHTHGATDPRFNSENFSISDKLYARDNNLDAYVGTPSGALLHYPGSGGRVTRAGTVRTR